MQLFSAKEWAHVTSDFCDLSLIQTWEYGEAKSRVGGWSVERGIFCDGDCVIGAVQAFVRRIGLLDRGVVWINRGPLWRRSDTEKPSTLIPMLQALRRYWAEERGMYLRIALPVSPGLLGHEVLQDVGYQGTGASGWASARVDLASPIDDLRHGLGKKWRQPLQKAERGGIEVVCGFEDVLFADFLGRYQQFVARRKFTTSVTSELLYELKNVSEYDRVLIVSAKLDGQNLGSIAVAGYGDTAEYLAAVVEDEGRLIGAGHLLLWNAICKAKSLGYRWFDVGGMSPARTPPGIFKFKNGLGGLPYQHTEEVEAYNASLCNRLIRFMVKCGRA